MPKPITLYMVPISPPVRSVLLTAAALGIELENKVLDIANKEHLSPEYLNLNPQHTLPLIDDNGTIVWESHAIMAYLVSKYGKNDQLYPKDFAARAVVDQRLHFETGVIFSLLRRIVAQLAKGQKPIPEADQQLALEGYQFLEAFLTDRKWVAGDSLTIADFSLFPSIHCLSQAIKIDEKQHPNIIRWFKQAEQLSYYKVNSALYPQVEEFIKKLTT